MGEGSSSDPTYVSIVTDKTLANGSGGGRSGSASSKSKLAAPYGSVVHIKEKVFDSSGPRKRGRAFETPPTGQWEAEGPPKPKWRVLEKTPVAEVAMRKTTPVNHVEEYATDRARILLDKWSLDERASLMTESSRVSARWRSWTHEGHRGAWGYR